MRILLVCFTLTLGFRLQGSAIVFSNLQENSLKCGCLLQGNWLGSPSDDPWERYIRANAFETPASSAFTVEQVELAVGLLSGKNAIAVSLYTDADGAPGRLLESFTITDQMGPLGLDHSPVVADSRLHPTLAAGSRFWLVASVVEVGTSAGWYTNNMADLGLVGGSINDDQICCIREDLRNAFAVFGTPVTTPESSSGGMASIGVGLLLAAHRLSKPHNRCRG